MALKSKPDLILLDVMMPIMDGYEVCRCLKDHALTVAIPIIFITALNHEDDECEGLDAGAIDYIVKPFHGASIQAKVRNHLKLQELLTRKLAQVN